eukprot:SAG11_NODE_207_length_12378_cov_8.404105_2_plen_77_part_00
MELRLWPILYPLQLRRRFGDPDLGPPMWQRVGPGQSEQRRCCGQRRGGAGVCLVAARARTRGHRRGQHADPAASRV